MTVNSSKGCEKLQLMVLKVISKLEEKCSRISLITVQLN